MVIEAREDYLQVLFDWPATVTAEEKQRLSVSLASTIQVMQKGHLLAAAVQALSVAGHLLGEKEVAEHAIRLVHATMGVRQESGRKGPVVRPRDVFNNSSRNHNDD